MPTFPFFSILISSVFLKSCNFNWLTFYTSRSSWARSSKRRTLNSLANVCFHLIIYLCWHILRTNHNNTVQCTLCCTVLRIRGPVPFDPGIPNPYFWELSDNCFGKKFYNSLKTGPNFFLQHSKNKIIYNFVKFMDTIKGMPTNFFSPLSFIAVFVSGIRDTGWVKIRIRDPE